MSVFRYRSWQLAACAAATAVACAAGMAGAASSSAASAGCSVSYTVTSQWPGGFNANVAITNLGSPLTSWALTWDFTASQQVTQGWSATYSQAGTQGHRRQRELERRSAHQRLGHDRLQRLVEQRQQSGPGGLRPQWGRMQRQRVAITQPHSDLCVTDPDSHADRHGTNPDAHSHPDTDRFPAGQLQVEFKRGTDQPAR